MINDESKYIDTNLSWSPYGKGYPNVGEENIIELENEIELSLPQDYRNAIVLYAGCRVEPCGLDVKRGISVSNTVFGRLYFTTKDPEYQFHHDNMRHVLEELREGELSYWINRDPRRFSLIPFAGDSADGYFCFDYSLDKNNPPVVWLDINLDPAVDGVDESIQVVASSFTDLLSKLRD